MKPDIIWVSECRTVVNNYRPISTTYTVQAEIIISVKKEYIRWSASMKVTHSHDTYITESMSKCWAFNFASHKNFKVCFKGKGSDCLTCWALVLSQSSSKGLRALIKVLPSKQQSFHKWLVLHNQIGKLSDLLALEICPFSTHLIPNFQVTSPQQHSTIF